MIPLNKTNTSFLTAINTPHYQEAHGLLLADLPLLSVLLHDGGHFLDKLGHRNRLIVGDPVLLCYHSGPAHQQSAQMEGSEQLITGERFCHAQEGSAIHV